MVHLLVVGVDTLVGANLAASLAGRYQVSTWSPVPGCEIPNCSALPAEDPAAAVLEACRPDTIIHCGPAARSTWEPGASQDIRDELVQQTDEWAAAAAAHQIRFVMISSDAIFTGPWLFHDEQSHGVCSSYQSQVIRAAETQVLEHCPEALIFRTHAFGWSPDGNGWIESLLQTIEASRFVQQDHIRHATPILATDLADILDRALQENLTGIHHVAGAERVSPLKFAQRLADQFDLPWLAVRKEASLCEIPAGFGEGECSLHTKKIRKALCVAMPLLSEGLQRLREQSENGFREKLGATPRPSVRSRAA